MSIHDISTFLENPSALVDVMRQMVADLEGERGVPGFEEKTTQLREISRTISKLEAANVAVPDDLRRIKTDLVAQLSGQGEAERKLSVLEEGLRECLKDIRASRGHPSGATGGRRRRRGTESPTTPRHVLRNEVIAALKALGGSGRKNAVLDHVENALRGTLLPGDLERRRTGGQMVWEHNTQFERLRMKHEGILKADSPRGVWELSENYR